MTDYRGRFQDVLRELFQFDAADLDFGIYRILNCKRDHIHKFIEQDISEIVDQAFARYRDERMEDLGQRLEEARQKVIEALNKDVFLPSGNLKEEFKGFAVAKAYQELKERKDDADATDEVKVLVYNDLYNFFSRYYDEGDFAPRYRYSIQGHKYAIPYNGEEVKLYWATSDQYYIKTGVLFRDYAFFADNSKAYKIILRTVAAKEELGSNKATKARFFVLDDEKPLELVNENTLVIRLQYRELTAPEVKRYEAGGGSNTAKQDKINQHIMDAVLEGLDNPHLKGFLSVYSKNDRPLLAHQLPRFTAKNSRDFFIHKNLKKFLSEQLDYFIKAEVISIETLERERFLDRHITRAKIIREIGGRIIDFLAQIEDFQKKLWEKKKFVLKTEYVITTDRVPEEFYPEILKNKKQAAEWQALGFGKAPSKAGLKEKKLPIDTRHFPEDFKERLLEKLTEAADLDDLLDGLMIKSENWQGLNLLQEKYRGAVKCVYIDPPYNTGSDEFVYRDDYQHSSWLTMMEDRLRMGRILMSSEGSVFVSIDDGEQARLREVLETVFGAHNFVNNIIWQKKFSPQNDARWFSDNHDFLVAFARDKELWRPGLLPRTEAQDNRYRNPDNDPRGPWMSSDLSVKTYSAAYDYTITTPTGRQIKPPEGRCWFTSKEKMEELVTQNGIWFGHGGDGVPRLKRFLSGIKQGVTPITVWTYKEVGHNQEGKQELKHTLSKGEFVFGTPKPVRLMSRVITVSSEDAGCVLDFFPGSGTTAHAVMNLNREDGGKRKFILIEMANYFDTVMIPRIKKVAYSFNWKDGKPKDSDGNGVFFKYQVLEQYEDTLDNLELKENREALSLFGNDYLLKYFLDFESRDNAALVNFDNFKKPFSYRLKVNPEEVGEPEEVVVDLPETFHYLLGLKVKKIKFRKDKGRKYLFSLGQKGGRNIAVVWREYDDDWTKAAFQKDRVFIIQEIQDWAPSVVYVNGQSALTPTIGSHTAEVRAIEPEFRKRMVDAS
jgi:adenine-specific DNA-methyltransferase